MGRKEGGRRKGGKEEGGREGRRKGHSHNNADVQTESLQSVSVDDPTLTILYICAA